MKPLVLGYSPFDAPTNGRHYGIGPFDELFDKGVNLISAKDLSNVDAVVLWGGSDICTAFYGEEPIRYPSSGPVYPTDRDLFEWQLLKLAKAENKPVIGVCRGAQLICSFAGGHLVQHVTGHQMAHMIETHDGKEIMCSSAHHQMMYPYNLQPEEYKLLAWCKNPLSDAYLPDRYYTHNLKSKVFKEPEVVYFPNINAMAIQCHPEWHNSRDLEFNSWMFDQILSYQYSCEA